MPRKDRARPNMPSNTLCVQLTAEQHAWLTKRAAKEETYIAVLVRNAVDDYIKSKKNLYGGDA